MNNNLEKFIQDLESIKMTSLEKNEMRKRLMSFSDSYTPLVSPYHTLSVLLKRGVAIAFIAVISFGSLSDAVSNNALPGDAFYPVKIAHEEIKLAATIDTQKKITYEIKRTEKRIQEAANLADRDKLDTVVQDSIAQEIKKQTAKVKEYIKEVKEEDPEEALILNSELKSTIKVNQEALRKVTTPTQEDKVPEDISNETEPSITLIISEDGDNLDISEESMSSILPITNDISESIEIRKNESDEMEISFADQLLESITEEVLDIEAFEEEVTQEIIESESNTEFEISTSLENIILTEEESVVSLETSPAEESTPKIITTEEDVFSEMIVAEHIKSLEDLQNIKERIQEVKKHKIENLIIIEDNVIIFNEEQSLIEANIFIEEKKYKNAFITLQTILEKYTEENITKEVESDLGIDLEENLTKEENLLLEKDINESELIENTDNQINTDTRANTILNLEIPVVE